MPKKPMNYDNSCIYKLCCNDLTITELYVGSTTNFTKRKSQHKSDCYNINRKSYNHKVYQFIRDNGNWDNWSMILIKKVKVNDIYELHREERKYIEQLNATLNYYIPTRTNKEWYENNKDKRKEWYQSNKDKIQEKSKEYYENNKDKILEYQKQRHDNNKDKINEKKKEYYENNKDKIKDKMKEKVECEFCKSIVCKGDIRKHQRTKKCIIIRNKVI